MRHAKMEELFYHFIIVRARGDTKLLRPSLFAVIVTVEFEMSYTFVKRLFLHDFYLLTASKSV